MHTIAVIGIFIIREQGVIIGQLLVIETIVIYHFVSAKINVLKMYFH